MSIFDFLLIVLIVVVVFWSFDGDILEVSLLLNVIVVIIKSGDSLSKFEVLMVYFVNMVMVDVLVFVMKLFKMFRYGVIKVYVFLNFFVEYFVSIYIMLCVFCKSL